MDSYEMENLDLQLRLEAKLSALDTVFKVSDPSKLFKENVKAQSCGVQTEMQY